MSKNTPISAIKNLQHQLQLLQLEYEFEKAAYRQQSESMEVHRKIKRGICWLPLRIGKNYYNAFNQLVVEVERTEDKEVEHNFEFGKPVCFFAYSFDGTIRFLPFVSQVSYADENRMVATLPSPGALQELQTTEKLGVQLYFDETSYKTMFEALHDVIRAKENRLSTLREILLDRCEADWYKIPPIRFPWLNPSQERAVNKVIAAKDVAIIHGPPGTGKTTTMVEAIYETLHREHQVLVCAQSNMAVDWISEQLVDRGVPVLRIGNPTRVTDKMLSFTYERQFESHPAYPELWQLRKLTRETGSQLRKGNNREEMRRRINAWKEKATELEVRIHETLFNSARVVAGTLISCNHRTMTGRRFPTLFIDEAAQALEAACWVAIRKADRVVFAGDHQQLPPTIKCPEAMKGGLDQTLMAKTAANKPESLSLLEIQYRMNEEIMRFSSDWFYGGRLTAAPEVKYRGILDYDTPLEWIDTSGCGFKEELVGESFGRINKEEGELLVSEIKKYILKIGVERVLEEQIDFGIISPYKAQIQYLRRLLRKDHFFRPFRKVITVNTVDGFQGQERDVILVSLVRANDKGQIGFLNDLRRMNVAITRARMKLIISGEAETLTRHPFYKKLYDYIEAKGVVIRGGK